MEIPVQKTLFRVLPSQLQNGKEISVCVVLFTQGVNEQQSLADAYVFIHHFIRAICLDKLT